MVALRANATNLLEDLYTSAFILGDSPYDLVNMDVIWTPKFAAAGWLKDLSNEFSTEELAVFSPNDIEGSRYEGKLYRVPIRSDAGVLYYRKDLLTAAGYKPPETFDELMKNRGIEPILPGYTEDDGFKWCIDGINQCLATAEQNGVLLALENHWGLGSTPEGLIRIKKAIDSPWLSILMDTGNFLENPYSKLEMIAPYTQFVQAKTYYGGGEWYSLELDYKRIVDILRKVNYQGYISIEFEGKEAAESGVQKSVDLLRKALG